MSSTKQIIVEQHKQEYVQLILKQKTEILDRYKQKSQVYIAIYEKEQELLSLSNQPICKPKKFKTEEAIPISQRYYAFVETLFVIDTNYFPQPLQISYENYIQTIVDTANIIFQSKNDLDLKIEIIMSNIVYFNIVQPVPREPHGYEQILRGLVNDYDKYDSIVLLCYQPWEGKDGAQGYAIPKGICNSANIPYQNAGFYLAHEIGHQLGLIHQVDTTCYTTSYMTVMTRTHTASYEQARWSKCENNWINNHICEFGCLFNKPINYQPIKNKYSTMPGKRMNNDQQARMIEPNEHAMGEVVTNTYMPTNVTTRCLYFRYFIEGSNSSSPMLPGSQCDINSVCYEDQCVSLDNLDSSLTNIEYDNKILDLTTHCTSNNNPEDLKASNHDPHTDIKCINWENDYLCHPSEACPQTDDSSTRGLYIRHVCCAKCSSTPHTISTILNRARINQRYMMSSIFIVWIVFLF
ncbi:unnamed protein product [Adineta steineri]|uniref:Peptidase M12B domain-containing protein n=1 Tax=Adineta steineri TaxID=433720 RepID=A0A818SN65_9BILA|nr:unnamed protein product [Adineta steineri]